MKLKAMIKIILQLKTTYTENYVIILPLIKNAPSPPATR